MDEPSATSVEAEQELENQLSRIKVRCDSDSIHSSSGSTVSTQSGGSAASSPLNESAAANANLSAPASPPRTPTRKTRVAFADDEEKSAVPPPAHASSSAVAAAQRFGVAKPVVGVRRIVSSTDLPGRIRSNNGRLADAAAQSESKPKKLSSTETRRAYALSVKARMAGNANVDDGVAVRKPLLRKRSSGSSQGSESGTSLNNPTTSLLPAPGTLELITPSIIMTPRQRRDSIASTTSSVSSIASSPSTTSSVSNMSARSGRSSATTATTASRLHRTKSATATPAAAASSSSTSTSRSPGKLSSGVPPPKVAVMQKLLQASNSDTKDARVDADLVKQLKQQYVLAEQGVQLLLKPAHGTMPPSPMRGAEAEVRRLKSGMKTLNEHSVALMLACEVLQRQQDAQQDEISQMQLVNDQLMREMEILAAANKRSSELSMPLSGDSKSVGEEVLEADCREVSSSEDGSDSTGSRGISADSSLSAFVNEMLRKATEKIEEKWKARFAEKLAEHEWALAVERERASASVMSNSRLVTETKHEKEDELKALREENISVKLENKQLSIEMAALHTDLDYLKSQLSQQDEIRNSSSFWEKTTDLAKQNRTLTEELTLTQQNAKKLDEAIKDLRTQNQALRAENEDCVKRTKEFELEKQMLQDQLAQVTTKFDDEKTRREQFQINVEQLTVENTALYAQMVALQATHEAKMEELRASFEKRNVILAGEMRALEAQNRLMRRKDLSGASEVRSHASSSSGQLSAEAEREFDARLQQVTDELLSVRQELVARTDQITELERKVADGEILRRKLHNTIQELRGNIRVHVRLRPFLRSDGEEARAEVPRSAIRCDTFGGTISTNVEKPHTFAFDKVYGQSESQEAVFSDVADFIQSALDGYNVCIFAYGQTGSGKTHTMQGSGKAQMRGIIPRALQLIINSCRELSTQGWQYTLDVIFFEIYNETIRDLLCSAYGGSDGKYNIRTDKRGKNYVEGLVTVPIDFDIAEDQLEEIVNLAACNRSVDKTDMNAHSSRSHSIFGLTIRGVNEVQNTEVEGTLSLVDLAGSERLSRSNATGDRLKEAQAINKSLSAMADVFQALAKKSAHVPYRNSKLTYVLQPALSGDGKTLMMVNLSPTFQSIDESICSLRFAQNVSQCELGAPTRQIKAREPSSTAVPAGIRSSPARVLTSSSNATNSPTTSGTRTRSLTATASPPIAKKLQF